MLSKDHIKALCKNEDSLESVLRDLASVTNTKEIVIENEGKVYTFADDRLGVVG